MMLMEISLSVSDHNIEWGPIMTAGMLIALPLIFTFLLTDVRLTVEAVTG